MSRRRVRRISRGRGRASISRRGGSLSFGGAKIQISTGFLAGLAAGVTNFDNKIPADARIALAAAPVSGIGMVKGFAQGMILADIVQKRMGYKTPSVTAADGSVANYRGAAFVGI